MFSNHVRLEQSDVWVERLLDGVQSLLDDSNHATFFILLIDGPGIDQYREQRASVPELVTLVVYHVVETGDNVFSHDVRLSRVMHVAVRKRLAFRRLPLSFLPQGPLRRGSQVNR
jgi:hypothetical protein